MPQTLTLNLLDKPVGLFHIKMEAVSVYYLWNGFAW